MLSLYNKYASELKTEEKKPTPVQPATVSEEQKKEAEKYKLEGNRYMAQQKFADSVVSYTEAIENDPTNAIYYSNRSAAYSSLRESEKAVEDARKAIEIDSKYSKGYSRLGLALYSLGDAEGSMEAYEQGLRAEGNNPTDGMKRGYETAKKRVQEELEATVPEGSVAEDEEKPSGSGGGGLPDFSKMFGNGQMPDLGSLMSNPQVASMARNMMSNPAFSGIMNNPKMQEMAEKFQSNGGMPSMADIMSNPELVNMAKSMFGSGASGSQNK